jgi:hypothetical protein
MLVGRRLTIHKDYHNTLNTRPIYRLDMYIGLTNTFRTSRPTSAGANLGTLCLNI